MSSCFLPIQPFEFSEQEIAETVRENRLLSMEIEFSQRCNLRCQYCYYADKTSFENGLTREEIHDVLLQAKALGARKIIILGGEPMVYPHIMETLHFLRTEDLYVEMFTNGYRISPDIAQQLFDMQVFVVVKMNSRAEHIQDALSGKKGAYKNIQEAFKNLLHAGYPGEQPLLAVSSIICQQNIDDVPAMWEWLRDQNIIPYFEMITPQGRARANEWLYVDIGRLEKLFYALSELDRVKYDIHWEPQPPLVGIKCQRHQYSCLVNAQGYVFPCVGTNIPVGNIRERKLADIIRESEVIQDLRNYRKYIKGPCRTCEKLSECYGCRGAAYQLTGDYLASDPWCWHNANKQNDIVHLPVSADHIIPQKLSMRVIDKLEKVSERMGQASVSISNDMLFVREDGTLDEAVYLELIAQTIAALNGFKMLGVSDASQDGYLLGARNLEILGVAGIGDLLTITVNKVARYGDFGIVLGQVFRGDEMLAQGEVKIWQKDMES
ncbi:MAG TPA: radical SAM protein [Candidatus Hydrogenedentes bacterium]|nr:radical SAM protein [Candidatus Hydrogenedentota bacterium]